VYSIIGFIIRLYESFLQNFQKNITLAAEQISEKNESKTKKGQDYRYLWLSELQILSRKLNR
jgi:hypothetical protein